MLNELDLELFEILDSEIDKTLSEGCIIYKKIVDEFEKIIHCFGIENELGGLQIGSDYFTDVGCFIVEITGEEFKSKYEIFGHYPTTNTVMRYIIKIKPHFSLVYGHGKIKVLDNYPIFNLDITKEIKDYTDIQKQELINFLKTL